MRVINTHERELASSFENAGALLDGLASKDDRIWPFERWPPMRFDRPLGVGAKGGHGPIRYIVYEYDPGRLVRFRFTAPRGFIGEHRFELESVSTDRVRLRHVIEMNVEGRAILQWLVAIRPLHDALLEDALDRAETFVGATPRNKPWSLWVKIIRWSMIKTRSSQRK